MSIIYTETKSVCGSTGDSRTWIDIGDGQQVRVTTTDEGVTVDVFSVSDTRVRLASERLDCHLGTTAVTFDEWADWVEEAEKDG